MTFREQTSIPSQSNSHSACFLSSFVLEARGGASEQAGPGLPSPGRRVSAFVPGMQALDQGREEKGDPHSATCVDSSLEGDLWGRSVSFRVRGGSSPASPRCVREPGLWESTGGSSPASPSCVHEPGRSGRARAVHPQRLRAVSMSRGRSGRARAVHPQRLCAVSVSRGALGEHGRLIPSVSELCP